MKFLLSVLFLFSFGFVFGQTDLEEVVYLKNGGSLRGTIIEQIPNESLKIQTKDGSVFVCKISEVEKITKEKVFISPYYNSNGNLAESMKRYKKSGIGLTTTAGVLIICGAASFAGGRNNYYYNGGGIISGITLLCVSAPFLISGPIMLAKYRRAKDALQHQKALSFCPSIKTHHTDGISSNASTAFTSYGLGVKFTF